MNVFVDKNGAETSRRQKSLGKPKQYKHFRSCDQHAVLDGGEVYYNSRKADLSADMHNLDFGSSFENAQAPVLGLAELREWTPSNRKIQSAAARVECAFDLDPQRFVLRNATLTSGNSRVVLNATVTDLSNPKLDADYNASLDAGEFRHVLKNATVPLARSN